MGWRRSGGWPRHKKTPAGKAGVVVGVNQGKRTVKGPGGGALDGPRSDRLAALVGRRITTLAIQGQTVIAGAMPEVNRGFVVGQLGAAVSGHSGTGGGVQLARQSDHRLTLFGDAEVGIADAALQPG